MQTEMRNLLDKIYNNELQETEELEQNTNNNLEEQELTEEEQIKEQIFSLIDECENSQDLVNKIYEMFDNTINESDWAKKTMARVKRATGTGMGSTDLSQSGKTYKVPTATVPDNATAPGMAKAPAFLQKKYKIKKAKAPGMAKAPRPYTPPKPSKL